MDGLITNFGKLVERALSYVKTQKISLRSLVNRWISFSPKYLVLKVFLITFPKNPARSMLLLFKLLFQAITKDNFLLLAYGPQMFRDTVNACESSGVKAFLLLGTLRSYFICKDFYKQSTDIDLGLTEEYWRKRFLLRFEMIQRGYESIVDNDWEILFRHKEYHSLMVDFTRVYKNDGHMQMTWGLTEDKKFFIHHCYPLEIFQEFKTVNFCHDQILVPSQAEGFLTIQYGENWRDLKIKKKTHYSQYDNVVFEPVVGQAPIF